MGWVTGPALAGFSSEQNPLAATDQQTKAGPGSTSANGVRSASRSSNPTHLCAGAAADVEGEVELSERPLRVSSLKTQCRLMLWKHLVTKLRDKKQLVASLAVPILILVISWLLR